MLGWHLDDKGNVTWDNDAAPAFFSLVDRTRQGFF